MANQVTNKHNPSKPHIGSSEISFTLRLLASSHACLFPCLRQHVPQPAVVYAAGGFLEKSSAAAGEPREV